MPVTSSGIPPKDRAQEGILWYIKSEGLKGGDRLMPERELAEKLGVSRTALRAAITQLISTHVLESRQGSGTYVLPPKPINIFQETYNYSDAVRRAGREPGSRLEYARLIEADEGLAQRTRLAAGAPLFEIRRIRFADDEPVAIETAYVNYAICPGIEAHDFAVESLYDVLAADYGVHVGHGQERISIARATSEEVSLLQVEEGSPVFFERAIECQADGVPVEYLKAVILPSRYRFASNGCENGSRPKEVKSSWLTW